MNAINKVQARQLLYNLEAPSHLIKHSELVCEVASQLVDIFTAIGISCNKDLVEAGAVLHDCGKIIHPEELYQAGNQHEAEGKKLLLKIGIDKKVASFCISHASWHDSCSIEELIVALSDKLWKGKREQDLEMLIITKIANILEEEYWQIFTLIDDAFEKIAAQADKRLNRSLKE